VHIHTNSARHRQASQLSRESTLCVSRLATGDDKKAAGDDKEAAGAGKLTHHITQEQVKGQPAHSQVHDSPVPGSQCCLLEVLDVSPVQVVHEVAAEWGPVAYEALLELHTGRTHQVIMIQTITIIIIMMIIIIIIIIIIYRRSSQSFW